MNSDDFYDLVADFFGPRATQLAYVEPPIVVTCTLYESFRFTCGLDGEHGEFGAGVLFAPDHYFTTFFGEDLSLNSDRESILASLRLVDEWCRLRLPDKFLERYDAALASNTN
jgi:hypothetical protein